ncbi:hypothetical protein PHYPO_G00139780 [Pangasianodon hypophthalmus]|uniref:Uncharacterized protein n=1 Tax=Pangasianodon hypophthalmus TaxID=310915 RepID=A0A5N5K9Z3_PANHP|nr:hypothetical protein PHYPO_G00139780 [Pangasianodon hypophthalmus]
MRSHQSSPGFNYGGPTGTVEPGMDPHSETTVLELKMNMNGGEEYSVFHPQGHLDMHAGGLQQQPEQQEAHIRGFFNNLQACIPPHGHQAHAHQHQSLFRGNFGDPGAGSSCLLEGRAMDYGGSVGPQQGFTEGFDVLAEGQSGDPFSWQQHQRLCSLSDHQPYTPSSGNHLIPVPCSPLDKSQNRTRSFHGHFSSSSSLSSSSESQNFETRHMLQHECVEGLDSYSKEAPLGYVTISVFSSSEPDSQPSHFGTGRHLSGANFPHISHLSQAPGMPGLSIGHHQAQQQQSPSHHNVFFERFGGVCKMPMGMEHGARHPIMQQQTEVIARQNFCPSSLPQPQQHDTGSANTSMHESSIVMPGQHKLEYQIQRLENKGMHSYGDPIFNMQQQPLLLQQTSSQRRQHCDSPYLNKGQRSRLHFPNAHGGEGPTNISMHSPPGLKNLSFSAYLGLSGEFIAPDSLLPIKNAGPNHQSVQQRQNAAMLIKQMASRNEQQRMKQPKKQQLGHLGDVQQNTMVHGGLVDDMSQSGFERDRGGKIVNFDGQNSYLGSDSGWFSGAHLSGEMLNGHRGGSGGKAGAHNRQQNGAATSVNSLDMQESIRIPEEGHIQCLHTPRINPQIGSNMENIEQMQSPGSGERLINTQSEKHPNDVSGPPIGGQNQQGEVQNTAQGVSTSPGNYTSHSEFSPGQQTTVSKIGALSLDSFDKASGKDSVFGQSCLAALSTACQNMIASLGASNINITFNKNQGKGKRKLNPIEQEMNNSTANGTVVSGPDYFPGAAKPVGPDQTVQEDTSSLSPCYNMESTPCSPRKATTGSEKWRGRRKRDSGHVSPGIIFPSNSGNPVMSPDQHAILPAGTGERRGETPHEKTLTSSSRGKGSELMLGDQPDLMSTLDTDIQRISTSADCCSRIDITNDIDSHCVNEDEVSCSSDAPASAKTSHNPLLGGWPEMHMVGSGLLDAQTGQSIGLTDHTISTSECCRGVDHPRMPGIEQDHTPSSTSGQDEVHPLEILQAEIQLQRQQFSLSEDQPLAIKKWKKVCDFNGHSEDAEFGSCSLDGGKSSVSTIDLDVLMAEQHATWFVPRKKNLLEDLEEDNSQAALKKTKEEDNTEEDMDISQHKSGGDSGTHGPGVSGSQRCITIHCTDELGDPKGHGGPLLSWCSLHSDISNHFGTYVTTLT